VEEYIILRSFFRKNRANNIVWDISCANMETQQCLRSYLYRCQLLRFVREQISPEKAQRSHLCRLLYINVRVCIYKSFDIFHFRSLEDQAFVLLKHLRSFTSVQHQLSLWDSTCSHCHMAMLFSSSFFLSLFFLGCYCKATVQHKNKLLLYFHFKNSLQKILKSVNNLVIDRECRKTQNMI